MTCQSCLTSAFNSLLLFELHVFLRHLVLVLDCRWHVGIWIIEMGRTRGEHVTSVLYLVRQQETHRKTVSADLAWQCALQLCLLFQTNSAWHTQMSMHKQTDTRPGQWWAHVQRRQTEDDAEWHLMGNQWTQTEECLTVTRLKCLWADAGYKGSNRRRI